MRIVSKSPTPAGVTNVVAAANSNAVTQNDFIRPAAMQIWHAHFNLQAVGVGVQANGTDTLNGITLCPAAGAVAEGGGDAGGAVVLVQVNHDFCSDFGNVDGLIGANN